MIRYIQGYEAKGPLGRGLKAVLTKLWMSMTESRPGCFRGAAKRQARLVIKGPLCQQSLLSSGLWSSWPPLSPRNRW